MDSLSEQYATKFEAFEILPARFIDALTRQTQLFLKESQFHLQPFQKE